MNLHSGSPFWLIRNGLLAGEGTPLPHDERCEVAIIGAGVTGALVADALVAAGRDVVVLDRRGAGLGSTAASTALLQYELDVDLCDLGGMIGADRAARAFQLCHGAIERLEALSRELGGCGFTRRSSLYLASSRRDRTRLMRETEVRQGVGLPAAWWPEDRVLTRYGFASHGAILSTSAAELDPLQLTRGLLARSAAGGARVYSRTAMTEYEESGAGVVVGTSRGHEVRADRLVIAMGYEVPASLRRGLVVLNSSYALASEVVDSFGMWDDRCLVWESARPYCYLRTTPDNRVLIGGEDVPFRDPTRRDRLLPEKRKRLERHRTRLLPGLDLETAFAWAGTFGETPDGLPYVGSATDGSRTLFALGYGGNGVVFSAIAAELLVDACCGGSNPDAELFALDRNEGV